MANLFEEDAYLKEFKTKIEKINKEEKYIKLIDTAFYAKSGGQPGDKGEIIVNNQKIEVLDTIKKDGEIVSIVSDIEKLEEKIEVIGKVELDIPKNKTFIMPAGDNREQLIKMYPIVFNMCAEHGYNMTGRDHIIAFDTQRMV